MSKKIVIPIVISLLAALVVCSIAYAANNIQTQPTDLSANNNASAQKNSPPAAGRAAVGLIKALDAGRFTLQTRRAGEQTILVDDETKFFRTDGSAAAFTDLKVGLWVAGRALKEQGSWVARRVVIFPEGFDPTQINQHLRGEITAVSLSGFTLHIPGRANLTIQVDAQTLYLGKIQSFTGIQAGLAVGVGAKKLDDGTLLAVVVRAHEPLNRHAGEIMAVSGSSFTLHTSAGETLTFKVNANTQFHSRDGSLTSLADLKTGMLAGVAASQESDGSYLAVQLNARVRPQIDLKAQGKVTAISAASFTIQAKDGQQYIFQVDANTRFRGMAQDLNDLMVGMRVGVAATDLGSAQYLAVLIQSGKK